MQTSASPSYIAKSCVCHRSAKPARKSFACHTCKTTVYKSFICHTSETPPPLLPFTTPLIVDIRSPPLHQAIARRAPQLLWEQHLQDILQAFILKHLRAPIHLESTPAQNRGEGAAT